MCKDIWEQTPAHRNYERWRSMCSMLGEDPKTYKPLIEATESWKKETEAKGKKFIEPKS